MSEHSMPNWNQVLLRGATARPTEVRAIEQRVQEDPANAVARVQALACTKGEVRAGHLLWLIQNAPGLPLDGYWMCWKNDPVYEAGKKAWVAKVEERPEDVSVVANAARYFTMSEPTLAEELLRRPLRSGASTEWMQALEGFYGRWISFLQVKANELERTQVVARARTNLEALYDAMPTDLGRYPLLWPLRRYAAMAQDPLASSLYMAASKESDRATHEHVSRTIRGLVAAARGDVSEAEKWLLDAADVLDASTAPAVRLAEELLRTGHRETVLRYIEACELVVGGGCPQLMTLRSRIVARDG